VAIEKEKPAGRAAFVDLERLFWIGNTADLSDGQLLEWLSTGSGELREQAFKLLVDRHGLMVLRVCRSALREEQDAQDAFQATFLVLLKRSRTLWVRTSIGPWLHQVAYRTSLCSRSSLARRRRHERRAARRDHADDPGLNHDRELARVIHEELGRLPARLRAPLILCDLEGASHEEAAHQLGWPTGTVKSRLSRGRERLRDRFRRRGLAPEDLPLAGRFPFDPLELAIFQQSAQSLVQTALAHGKTLAGPCGAGAALARKVIMSMNLTQFLKGAVLAASVGFAVSGASWLAQGEEPSGSETRAVKTTQLKRGPLDSVIQERGVVEATRIVPVVNPIQGKATVLDLVPDGTRVKKGDKIGLLDVEPVKAELEKQEFKEFEAFAAFKHAEQALADAEEALVAWQNEQVPEELFKYETEIRRGRFALKEIDARLKRLESALHLLKEAKEGVERQGGGGPGVLARLSLENQIEVALNEREAQSIAIERASFMRDALKKYRASRRTKELERARDTKRLDLEVQKRIQKQEGFESNRMRVNVQKCELVSSADGFVEYTRDLDNEPILEGMQLKVRKGVEVQEGKTLCRIMDLTAPLQIHLSIHESLVDQVKLGMPVQASIDAFPGEVLNGTITGVAPRPNPTRSDSSTVKFYSALVTLEETPVTMRPGMTALGKIQLLHLDDVLSVPHRAVVHSGGQDRVAIQDPDGGILWHVVTLGRASAQAVEIKEGLKEGDMVIEDPRALLNEDEERAPRGSLKARTHPK